MIRRDTGDDYVDNGGQISIGAIGRDEILLDEELPEWWKEEREMKRSNMRMNRKKKRKCSKDEKRNERKVPKRRVAFTILSSEIPNKCSNSSGKPT